MYARTRSAFCSLSSESKSPMDAASARMLILCASSLTPAVVEEALASATSLIVSYHPPIFKPLASITLATPLQASLLRCAAAGISIYTPHTALDAVTDGLNDWLCTKVAGPLRDINWSARFIGQEYPEGLGGVGRIVTLKQPVELKMLQFTIRTELELKHSASPRFGAA